MVLQLCSQYVSHNPTARLSKATKIAQHRRIRGRAPPATLHERGYASSQIHRQTPGKSLHSTVLRISDDAAVSRDPATVLQISSLASEIRLGILLGQLEDSVLGSSS